MNDYFVAFIIGFIAIAAIVFINAERQNFDDYLCVNNIKYFADTKTVVYNPNTGFDYCVATIEGK